MFEYLIEPYKDYPIYQIILEFMAMSAGISSVWFAKKNNILVYPSGLISTVIYVFLLFKWSLIGDMLINIYYSIMSVIGWIMWFKVKDEKANKAISKSNLTDKITFFIFFSFTLIIIALIYKIFNKFDSWYSYIDTLTSGIFFVGMLAMAKRKIEHWLFWIAGNFISIPLYFIKGFTITSFQYVIFLIMAIYGYIAWIKIYNKNSQKL